MDSLINFVKDFCLAQGFERIYWIGYSGGLDSHVLLHVLTQLRSKYPVQLRAVYIHHGLSPNADAWANHCAQTCSKLQVEFEIQLLSLMSNMTPNLEEVARSRRNAIFAKLLADQDILLTAHHQDDQAETVLMQLLRGAGPKGLAAMPRIKSFAKGFHARPLLNFTRDDLKKYAELHQLKWIEDESNQNIHFTRNFLRHEIVPILKKRWPNVEDTLCRVSENCADVQQVLENFILQDLVNIQGSQPNTISIKKLSKLDEARQRLVLREWLAQLNFPIPSAIKLQQVQHDMLSAREDKAPHFAWHGMELRRFRDDLYAMNCLAQHDATQIFHWDFSENLQLPCVGTLKAQPIQGQGLRADITTVQVRFRQGGEKVQLAGRKHHHALKNLLQEWEVPHWMRDRLPLIYVDEKIIAIPGYFLHESFQAQNNEAGYDITIGN